jgi:hypothetical protein
LRRGQTGEERGGGKVLRNRGPILLRTDIGHERLETTHLYLEADLALKERALQRLAPLGPEARPFKADHSVLAFLDSL